MSDDSLYIPQPAGFGRSDDDSVRELAFRIAARYYRDRCERLELDPDSLDAAPVIWFLTEPEMLSMQKHLVDCEDPEGRVLREQLEAVLQSITLRKEQP